MYKETVLLSDEILDMMTDLVKKKYTGDEVSHEVLVKERGSVIREAIKAIDFLRNYSESSKL